MNHQMQLTVERLEHEHAASMATVQQEHNAEVRAATRAAEESLQQAQHEAAQAASVEASAVEVRSRHYHSTAVYPLLFVL